MRTPIGPIRVLARHVRRLHTAIGDRASGPDGDRGGVLADVILMTGIAAAAVALVVIVVAAINRYGNVIAGLTP